MKLRVEPQKNPRWCAIRLYLSPEDRQPVSGLSIVDHQMRVGHVTLRMAGVAGVWTHEDHRMRGYARHVITRALEFMREQNYDVSMLFGIRHFYPKFGYAVTPFDYRVSLSTSAASQAEAQAEVRPWRPEDIPAILTIYAENNRDRTGSVVRSDDWVGFVKGSNFGTAAVPFVVVSPSGEVQGYFVRDDTDERCTLSEAGGLNPQVWPTILASLARHAEEHEIEEIQLLVPPDHPLALACKRYGCVVRIGWPCDGGGMMRIIHLESTFQKLLPELSRRWRESSSNWRGSLRLVTDIGEVGLTIGRRGVELRMSSSEGLRVVIPQGHLIQMIVGYRTASEIQDDPGVQIPEPLVTVLDRLFPRGYPYVWWSDRF